MRGKNWSSHKIDYRSRKAPNPKHSSHQNRPQSGGEYDTTSQVGPYKARTNIFSLTFDFETLRKHQFYLHDVKFFFKGEIDTKNRVETNFFLLEKWKSDYHNDFFAYDGKSLLLSNRKFSLESFVLAKYSMNITFTREIDLKHEYQQSSPIFSQIFQMILNQNTAEHGWNQLVGSKFFYDSQKYWKNLNIDPLRLWYGMDQHVIQYYDSESKLRLGVYRDMTAVVGIGSMPFKSFLEELVNKKFKKSEKLDLKSQSSCRRFLDSYSQSINSELKGLSITIETLHLPNKRKIKVREIMDFLANSPQSSFETEKGTFSVYTYFKQTYPRFRIEPHTILVNVGRPNRAILLPIEACYLHAQRIKNLSLSIKEELKKNLVISPSNRIDYINSINRNLIINNSGILKLSLSQQMKEVNGEILPPPKLVYNKVVDTYGKGSWNLRDLKLLNSCSGNVFFIHLSRESEPYVEDFLQSMAQYNIRLRKLGTVTTKLGHGSSIDLVNLTHILEKNSRMQINLLIIFLPYTLPYERKEDLKAVTDSFFPSQYLNMESIRKNSRNLPKYWANVALKINLKLGGQNHKIDDAGSGSSFYQILGNDSSSLILGADVTYFSDKKIAPSIASIVGTVDDTFTVNANICSPQAPKQEIIENFSEAIDIIFDSRRKNGIKNPPRKVLYMRDGVSTSQLEDIALNEIPKLKAALSNKCAIKPKLLCIVAVKRHGKRFFSSQQDMSPPPGFAVLNDLKENIPWPNFYLQAHTGRIGTLSSTNYFILENDFDLSIKKCASLVLNLCYLWARSTSAISIPAPIKCADIAASRYRGSLRKHLFDSHRINLSSINEGSRIDTNILQQSAIDESRNWHKYNKMYYV